MKWKLLVAGVALAILASVGVTVFLTKEPAREEEHKKTWSGRTFAAETEVERIPTASPFAQGFDSERVWSGEDDWEPAIAADPSSSYVYQLTTRFSGRPPCSGCPLPAIAFRSSSDGGATWYPDKFLAPTNSRQADPEIEVANNGTIFAAFLNGGGLGVTRSQDRGKTWTRVFNLPGIGTNPRYSDKPIIAISSDGKHVYIGFNAGNSYVSASHNFGKNFSLPVKTSSTNRTFFHTGGAVAADGTVYFSTTDFGSGYQGDSNIRFLKSTDRGKTWITTLVDTSREVSGCSSIPACYFGFLGPSAAMAVDATGKIMIAYHANDVAGTPQRMYTRTSLDGVHWSPRKQISVSNPGVNNAFPALAAGPTSDDFRVAWQDDRNGSLRAWNTWFRRTTNGGTSWSKALRISNRNSGAPYKSRPGFRFPYGDYFEIAVSSDGMNHLIWGEGISYLGPGGSWYTSGSTKP